MGHPGWTLNSKEVERGTNVTWIAALKVWPTAADADGGTWLLLTQFSTCKVPFSISQQIQETIEEASNLKVSSYSAGL